MIRFCCDCGETTDSGAALDLPVRCKECDQRAIWRPPPAPSRWHVEGVDAFNISRSARHICLLCVRSMAEAGVLLERTVPSATRVCYDVKRRLEGREENGWFQCDSSHGQSDNDVYSESLEAFWLRVSAARVARALARGSAP